MSTPINTIFSWFETGDFPTQQQFQATFSSFFHKDENIPAEKIQGLSQMFQGVATSEAINNHIQDPDAHTEYLAKKNAENIDEENVQQWRDKLNIAGTAYVDTAPGADDGNVYNKEQIGLFFETVNTRFDDITIDETNVTVSSIYEGYPTTQNRINLRLYEKIQAVQESIAAETIGFATSANSPTPWTAGEPDLFEKYFVEAPAILTNYLDFNGDPIEVTAADFDYDGAVPGNRVSILVYNGVAKKWTERVKGEPAAVNPVFNPENNTEAPTMKGAADYIEDKLYTDAPLRINANENTATPDFFGAAPDAPNTFGIRIEADTESPTKDILPYKRVFFNNDDANGATCYRTMPVPIGAERPNIVSFAFWAKKTEIQTIHQNMQFLFGVTGYNFPMAPILAGGEGIVTQTGLAIPEYSDAIGKLKIIASKTIGGTEFIRLRFNIEDIVWKAGFTGSTIVFYYTFTGASFFQKELSIYDFTILLGISAEQNIIYSGSTFKGTYTLKSIESRLSDIEALSVLDFNPETLYEDVPTRINKNENTLAPEFFSTAPDGRSTFGIRIESDTESPTKDILPYKRVFFNNDDAAGATMFRVYSVNIGSARPSLVSFAFWFKRSEFESAHNVSFFQYFGLHSNFKFNTATLLTGVEVVTVVTGLAIPEYSDAVGKAKIIATKTVEGTEFIRLRFNIEDIVWKPSFNGTSIPYYYLFNFNNFYQKELSVYDFTILFNESVKGEVVYNDLDGNFDAYYNLKTLNQKIEVLEDKINTDTNTTGKLRAKRVEDKVYVGMPFGDTTEVVEQINVFRNSLTDNANNNVNFEQEYSIPKGGNLTAVGTLIKGSGDDQAPPNINNSYIGANHGWNQPQKITKTAHGKTFADIGKLVTDAVGNEFTIIQITDTDNFVLCAKNKAIDGFSYSFPAPSGTLTFPDGTITGYTAASMGNTYDFVRSLTRSVLINGENPLADGVESVADFVDIIDSYDVYDLTTVVTKIMQNAGNYTSNPDFTDVGADKLFRMNIIYRFTGNVCLFTHNFYAYKKMNISFLPFIQMSAMNGANLYINKALPVSDGVKTFDFRKGENWTVSPATSLDFAPDKWEGGSPPDRFVLYTANHAIASGYIIDKGWDRTQNTSAGWLNTTRKVYPFGVRGVGIVEAGAFYSQQTYRSYQNRADYPVGRISQIMINDQHGEFYLMMDWNATIKEVINLPKEAWGKEITIIEKTSNVNLYSNIATPQLMVDVTLDVTNVYGYLVLKIK